ncbi:MAG: hypothetical protein JO291_15585 [Acidimicrobiia bacterium]|nr:hypothetical protein [Acidimicrobiia bacterium]
MGTRSVRRALAVFVPAGAFALVAAITISPGSVAAARPSITRTPAVTTTQSTRNLVRRASLGSLADGVGHLPPGTLGPDTPPGEAEPDAAAARSASVRGLVDRSYSRRPDPAAPQADAGALPVPVASNTPVSGQRPGLGTSYEGVNLFQERYVAANGNQFSFEPPDQGLCVGNGYVLETVNTVLRVFDTAGHPKSPPVALNGFYRYPPAINRTTGKIGPELTDPSCFYDSLHKRWIHVVLTLDVDPSSGDLTLNNHIDLAVSKTASPLGGWVFYSFNTTDDGSHGTPHHAGCPCIGDYPHIAADHNGVYITVNEYPWDDSPGVFGNNFNGSQLYALSRRAVTSGARNVRLVQLSNLALRGGTPAFTLIGANSPGNVAASANGGSEYFLSSTAAFEARNTTGRSNRIGLWTLQNTRSLDGNHLALTLARKAISTEVYGVPPFSEQKQGDVPLRDCIVSNCHPNAVGGPANEVEGPIDSSDSRMFNTWYANGRIWGSLSTIVQVGGNIQAGAAWFSLTPSGSVAHQGYLATTGNNVIYPGIATLADGRGAMAVNVVGRNWFPTAAYALVDGSGVHGIHVAAAGRDPQDGFCEYDFENCAVSDPPAKRPRWGDYPAAQASGNSIWIANEYIAHACTFQQWRSDFSCDGTRGLSANWSTRVSKVTP